MDSIECAKRRIRRIIAGSRVPEDPCHAQNTLEWLLRLEAKADQASLYLGLSASLSTDKRDRKGHNIRRRGNNTPAKGGGTGSLSEG